MHVALSLAGFWVVILLQVVGLASAFWTRACMHSATSPVPQRMFFGCLLLVGVSALIGMSHGPGYCLMSGMSLAAMVMAAVCDFGPRSLAVS